MKKIISKSVTALLLVTSLNAASTTCDTLDTSIENLGTTVTDQQALVSKLSDDIGVMADRIGTMADRIVATEKLLSETLLALTGSTSNTLSNTAVMTAPLDSSTASKTTAPTITILSAPTAYLLYASTSPKFEQSKSIVLYIDSDATLSTSWTRVSELAATNGDVIYIAVKSINNNLISALSNGVKLTLQ
jgi:uncharacterized coiled-coil protein SlyX